jgi:p-cumate 2,3-dioxygenase beta subunit
MTQTVPQRSGIPVTDPVLLSEIEQYLYREAHLLDSWQLDEWLALMRADVVYRVPSPGTQDRDPRYTLQVISDNHLRLSGRVTRLKSKHAHAESPKSHTRRLVSNVRAETGDGELHVFANFHVLRTRLGQLDNFIGTYRYVLVRDDTGALRIRERVATLDHGIPEAGGSVSIIL